MDNIRESLGNMYKECPAAFIVVLQRIRSPPHRSRIRPSAECHRMLTEGQESANRQRQVQSQARFGAIEVDAGDFVNAIHSIEQCVTMHD